MTTTNTEILQNIATQPITWPQAASARPHFGPEDVSRGFLAILALLGLATGLFCWNQQRTSEKRSAEISRQNLVAAKVYHAIERYADAPSALNERVAKVALELAPQERLTENRQALLSNFYQTAKRCHLGGKYNGSSQDCHRMNYSRFSARSAAVSEDLDEVF
jgi:uncharacterized protein HemX